MSEMTIAQAINLTLQQELERNERVVVFGQDVGVLGGVFRVTSGIQKKFGPDRCFDTPLSEAGIVGFAIGMAQKGFKPVCEIQFADFIFPAYDQIVNELAKMRYRTGNQFSASVVIRTPYGGGVRGGHYHSQSPEAQFLHTPGLIIVFPATPYEAKGLLTTALRSNDPILFFEPKRIYRSFKQEVPLEEYQIPFGQASIEKIGKDVTLIGWGAQHHQNTQAAEELLRENGIEVEVINLRTLNPLDISCIEASVVKTKRCVVAHEAPKTQGFGAELASLIMERCFLHLEAPVMRCCGFDTPFPHALENAYLPDAFRVKHDILKVLNY